MKKSYDKALKRLMSILSKLNNDERPNISELALEFGVSKRTIQYDIYDRLIDYPIVKDCNGRLRFGEGYTLV